MAIAFLGSHDVENRLTDSGNVALRYDPLGRLHQILVGGAVTTTFLYDGDALIAEYDGANNMTRRYVHRVGADVPLVSFAGARFTSLSQLFAERQGSIVAHADWSGNVTQVNRYDEYGIPGATNQGRFQYTGQIWLAEVGLYHYKARVYSPTLGRFLQVDPVGYDDQVNLYAYVGNDPVNRTDPTGTRTREYDTCGSRVRGANRCVWTQEMGPEDLDLMAAAHGAAQRSGSRGGARNRVHPRSWTLPSTSDIIAIGYSRIISGRRYTICGSLRDATAFRRCDHDQCRWYRLEDAELR